MPMCEKVTHLPYRQIIQSTDNRTRPPPPLGSPLSLTNHSTAIPLVGLCDLIASLLMQQRRLWRLTVAPAPASILLVRILLLLVLVL